MSQEYPDEVFDRFYGQLIGNQERCLSFQKKLHAAVYGFRGDFFDSDPYGRLATGFSAAIISAVDEANISYPNIASNIIKNGETGATITTVALRMLGRIYNTEADCPQELEAVTANVDGVLGHVYRAAHAGAIRGGLNLEAFLMGVNPRNQITAWLSTMALRAEISKESRFFKHSFVTRKDGAGQLEVRPRYPRQNKSKSRGCPAAKTSIVIENRTKSGLLTAMKVAGSVAIRDIYPNYFDIIWPPKPFDWAVNAPELA